MNSNDENSKKDFNFIHISAKTWNRDSHGLFDYENTSVKCNYFTSDQTGFIVRRKNEVKFLTDNTSSNNSDEKELFKVIKNNSNFD
jgi:hypothetical protein